MWRWRFGVVQYSEWDADGFLGVQIDPIKSGSDPGGANLAEVMAPYGFFARPRDPDSDGRGCSFLQTQPESRERYAWLGTEPRALPLIPNGAKGTSYQFALTDDGELSFHEIDGETGTHSIYVPVGDSAHFVQIGVDSNGDAILKLQHSEGMAIILFKENAIIHNAAGDAYVQIGADGIICNGNTKVVGGFEAGGVGAAPLVLHAKLASAISSFSSAIAAAVAVPNDGGAAVLVALKAAAAALASATSGMGTTLTKGL
jgi:hypothetical protein